MSESVHISSATWVDRENVGVAFGVSLLSCMEAETLHYFICISGNGGRLQFHTYPDVGECSQLHIIPAVLLDPIHVGVVFVVQHFHYSHWKLDPESIEIAVGISLPSCVQAEIYAFQV